MADLPFGISAYSRDRGALPEFPVVNMFAEKSSVDPKGVILQSRKGIVADHVVGDGPIQAMLQKDGVFGGDEFVVSGGSFYRAGTLIGDIDGVGVCSMVATELEVMICCGQSLYSYDGTDLVAVTFPDGASVTKIGYASGYFIALRKDTQQWYFSALLDGRSWDGLDYASAENEPDRLLDLLVLDGAVVFFGSASVEFWASTGDPDLPFAPIQQRVFEQGIAATGCAISVDNSFFWIGDDRITYRNDNSPQAIDDDGIVERSIASEAHRLFLITDERHKLVCARFDASTMVYDVTTGQWSEFQSYGRSNWRVGPSMGDTENGTIWRFTDYADDGGMLERRFRAGAPLDSGLAVSNLRLVCEVGQTPFLADPYAEPVVEMRYSDDAGRTWSSWEAVSLGRQGEYRTRPEWRALGMFDDPGMIFDFRVTDPVSWRVNGVKFNEKRSGRAR